MRSYVLAGNTGTLRRRDRGAGGDVACGCCRRSPAGWMAAGDRSLLPDPAAAPIVDAVVSLTGFSLVGGPAYNDARAAEEMLASLDVPYIAAHPVEFQTLEQWKADDRAA